MWEQKFLYMSAFGIMKKIKRNSVPDQVIPKPTEDLEPLTMEPFVLAFLILPIGLGFSTVVLLLEVFTIRTQMTNIFK